MNHIDSFKHMASAIEQKYIELSFVLEQREEATWHVIIDIQNIGTHFLVALYLENWVTKEKLIDKKVELELSENQLNELLDLLNEIVSDSVLIVAPIKNNQKNGDHIAIIREQSQINFDLEDYYLDWIEKANSKSLLKDSCYNQTLHLHKKEYETWKFLNDYDMNQLVLMKCMVGLNIKNIEEIGWRDLITYTGTILNREENRDKYIVTHNSSTECYDVKYTDEKAIDNIYLKHYH